MGEETTFLSLRCWGACEENGNGLFCDLFASLALPTLLIVMRAGAARNASRCKNSAVTRTLSEHSSGRGPESMGWVLQTALKPYAFLFLIDTPQAGADKAP